MSPFTPAGDRARWRHLYDVIRNHDIGDLISYDELAEAVDLHPKRDRHTIQVAMRRAAQESEVVDNRALEAVVGQGYRLVEPEEHLRLARVHQRKSSRALVRGERVATHVDLSGMEPETRKAFEMVAMAFRLQADVVRRLDVRQKRLEEAISAMSEHRERSDEEIAAIQARIERLERRSGYSSS